VAAYLGTKPTSRSTSGGSLLISHCGIAILTGMAASRPTPPSRADLLDLTRDPLGTLLAQID
jgi:hypothetical protein